MFFHQKYLICHYIVVKILYLNAYEKKIILIFFPNIVNLNILKNKLSQKNKTAQSIITLYYNRDKEYYFLKKNNLLGSSGHYVALLNTLYFTYL